MKQITTLLIIVIVILVYLQSQPHETMHFPAEETNTNDTSDLAALTEQLDWNTYHNDSVDGMHINSYFARNENDPNEILEMKVERKAATEDQEDISFVAPSSINPKAGLTIFFLNRDIVNGKDTAQFDPEGTIYIPLNELNDNSSIAYIPTGRIQNDKKQEINLLSKCSIFNHLMVVFEYRDGEQKSVLIPLMSFKEKYHELE